MRVAINAHVLAGHLPYRRDCSICQRGAATARPKRARPMGWDKITLSFDLSGPLVQAIQEDYKVNGLARYVVVGVYAMPIRLFERAFGPQHASCIRACVHLRALYRVKKEGIRASPAGSLHVPCLVSMAIQLGGSVLRPCGVLKIYRIWRSWNVILNRHRGPGS